MMASLIFSLNPLADYLEPQFGNIYDYNMIVKNGFDVRPWTDELRRAVKYYLVDEVSDDEYSVLLREFEHELPPGDRESQAEAIMDVADVWEIAYALHLAAISAVSTLEQLIGRCESWPDSSLRVHVAEWLDTHLSPEQLNELDEVAGHPPRDAEAPPWYGVRPIGEDFTWALTPLDLLVAWRRMSGPAESDLTDKEWELLVPLLPTIKHRYGIRTHSEGELLSLRRALDGIRYKFAHDLPWSCVPHRYGAWSNLYQRHMRYRDRGDFARMLKTLEGRPGTERIVAWLEDILPDSMRPVPAGPSERVGLPN